MTLKEIEGIKVNVISIINGRHLKYLPLLLQHRYRRERTGGRQFCELKYSHGHLCHRHLKVLLDLPF